MGKGNITIIENFEIPQLNRKRTIRIYTPPYYDATLERYPVIYMHDGQNLFETETSGYGMSWEISDTLDRMYFEGKIKGIIVVGIDNGSELGGLGRYNEYSPWKVSNEIKEKMASLSELNSEIGGEGFEYIDFIADTLKPYIDSNYRTLSDRNDTAIAGSSMGGYISIIGGIKRQEVFGKILSFSAAAFFNEGKIIKLIEKTGRKHEAKIYMDVGTNETSNKNIPEFPQIYIDANKNVYEALLAAGYEKREITFVIAEGAEHNEIEWAKRFPDMIEKVFE